MQPDPASLAADRAAPTPQVDVGGASWESSERAQTMAHLQLLAEDLRQVYLERNQALHAADRAQQIALLQLSMAAEYRDDDTGVHIVRIGYLAEKLAELLGETPQFSRLIRLAAPMHDIGKIGIPDSVLKKPGKLDPEERQIMNRHAAIGAQILGRSKEPVFQMAADVAQNHHERFNGSGYPAGHVGEDIPMSARIVSVVDFFDALTMKRCYRNAFTDDVALSMMQAERGGAFDPRLVDLFIRHADDLIAVRDAVNRSLPNDGATRGAEVLLGDGVAVAGPSI